MDWNSELRLKLMPLFLLVSTSIDCLHGNAVTDDYGLHCVTDYLLTINCSLTIPPSETTSDSNRWYWLNLTESFNDWAFVCNLTNICGNSSCSVRKPVDGDIFTDLNIFKISLCHKQNREPDVCEVLDNEFMPAENIKPNAPCCLTVTQNSSQHHFTWSSTYQQYSSYTMLVKNFNYQLQYYKRGDHVLSHDISTDSTNYSVDDRVFMPDSQYSARVRSSPNQIYYKGQWSDWSSEVQWKTGPAMSDLPTKWSVSGLGKVFIPLCVMVPLLLLLCYAPVKKWRQSVFIPTPAAYFHTLYSDCQGDFKSWVVTQENSHADVLKAEETLQIDTMTKCTAVQKEESIPDYHLQLKEGSGYNNIVDQICDTSFLGIPYAVSTMAPLSSVGSSLKNLSPTSEPGSPAEGDSGCWLCSDTSLEKDPPWYCNDYCTLSTFQQSMPVSAEQHGSLCTQGITTGNTLREA